MMRRLHDHFPALCRLYAGVDAVTSWYNSVKDPHSSLFHVAKTADGSFLLWMMAFIGTVIILDVIINDWTPASVTLAGRTIQLSWQRVFKYRHFLFVGLAFCYAAQPYVAEMGGRGVSLLVFFYSNSLQNLVIAFFDARLRSRSQGWQRAICS